MWALDVGALALYVLLSHLQVITAEKSCYAENKNPYLRFASKTDWRVAFNEIEEVSEVPPECQPAKLWMVTRPGASWPSQQILDRLQILHEIRDDIVANHEQRRADLCEQDINNLKVSRFPPDLEIPYTMEDQGGEDLRNLGQTTRNTFPSLLQPSYSSDDYEFRYTTQPNVEQSVHYFTKGLFGDKFDPNKLPKPIEKDTILDLPNNCDAWKKDMIGTCAGERVKFDKSTPMKTLITQVSGRLGFKNPLSIARVILMYQGCSLQKATLPNTVPSWCAVFSTSELKLLEYRDDVFYYRACGPGDDTLLVNRLSCPLVQDLIDKFQSAQEGKTHPPAIFYFTDDRSLLILLHGLGLVGSKIEDMGNMDQRTFQTSTLVPFAANFRAVLYKCSSGEGYRVGMYLGGRPVGGRELRPWSQLLQELSSYYLESLECRVDFCRVDSYSVKDYLKIFTGYGAIITMFATLIALTPV